MGDDRMTGSSSHLSQMPDFADRVKHRRIVKDGSEAKMTLIDLMTVMCFVMPITEAVAEAKLEHVHAGGYVVASLIGILIGIAFAWGLRASASVLAKRLDKKGWRVTQVVGTAAYLFGCVTWMVLGDLLGGWIVKPLGRIFS